LLKELRGGVLQNNNMIGTVDLLSDDMHSCVVFRSIMSKSSLHASTLLEKLEHLA
jgi:hypothetical protein